MKKVIFIFLALATLVSCSGGKLQKAKEFREAGRQQYDQGRYNNALVSFVQAARYAEVDRALQADIFVDIAHSCNLTYNTEAELNYLQRAQLLKTELEDTVGMNALMLEMGQAYFNLEDKQNAEKVLRSVIYTSHRDRDTLVEAQALATYASLALSVDKQDPSVALEMYGRASQQLGYTLNCVDMGNLAYAYSLLGMKSEAMSTIRLASERADNDMDRAKVRFNEYQIKSRFGDTAGALKALEDVTRYKDNISAEALRASSLSSVNEFYNEQMSLAESRLRYSRLRTWILVLFFLLASGGIYYVYRISKLKTEKLLAEEEAENERLMALAEEMKRGMGSFDVLERLCEQYYIYEGTENLQPRIIKEVKSMIDSLRDDPAKMEQSLNLKSDGLMKKFRAAYPKMKEDDVRLFCLVASGLSSTSISTIIGKDKQNVYNRIYRLKGKIKESDSADKMLFMEALSKG